MHTELNALLLASAARGGSISGGVLREEINIVFATAEARIAKAIACRKKLAVTAPELLLPFPHLKEFHTKLDGFVDGAIIALQQRHSGQHSRKFPAGSLDAVMKAAAMRATVLKTKINGEIQALALEGVLGMHRRDQPQVNISNSTIANLNLGTIVGDLNGSIQILTTAGQTELAAALRKLTEAISTSVEVANKKEMIENLTHISEEAALPPEKRKTGPLKAVMESLKTGVAVTSQLVALWQNVERALKAMGIG